MDEFGKVVMAKIDDSLSYLKDRNGFSKICIHDGMLRLRGRECLWESTQIEWPHLLLRPVVGSWLSLAVEGVESWELLLLSEVVVLPWVLVVVGGGGPP
jgi:hypothetical protein